MKRDSDPTDLELMMYADGELETERREVVARYLAASPDARAKIAGLTLGSALVRESALEREAAFDGIAHDVMAAIAREAALKALAPRPAVLTPIAVARPANDTSRSIYGLAAIALAAAVALFFWARGGDNRALVDAPPVAAIDTAAAPSAVAAPVEPPVVAPSAEVAADADPVHGVEVAAVEFGARMGTILYVPADSPSSLTTTVVWLADDAAGEE